MKSRTATEQLLVSDAIERSVDDFDFQPLAGRKVYLDTQYMSRVSAQVFLNSDYIRSCLREHMMLAGCVLQPSPEGAEVIVEVRVGALGTDGHEVNYGVPASQPLNAAASAFAGAPLMPVLPEVSLAKRNETRAAAKIHLFAYEKESMRTVWAPGSAHGESLAKSTWFFGAGPFERGSIYEQTQFAGAPIVVPEIQPIRVDAQLITRVQDSLRVLPLTQLMLPFGRETVVHLPSQTGSTIQQVSAVELIPENPTSAESSAGESEAVAAEAIEVEKVDGEDDIVSEPPRKLPPIVESTATELSPSPTN